MYAYELLAKLKHLSLVGQDEEGNLEWVGSKYDWINAQREENKLYGASTLLDSREEW